MRERKSERESERERVREIKRERERERERVNERIFPRSLLFEYKYFISILLWKRNTMFPFVANFHCMYWN